MTKPMKKRWQLKDLRDSAEAVLIHEWDLDNPELQYTAGAAHYEHQGGVGVLYFAQVLGEIPMNALALLVPAESVAKKLLPSLGKVRERLRRLEGDGRIMAVPPLKLARVVELRQTSNTFLQKSAEVVRVAAGENFASMDFYKLPVVPEALIEQRPNQDLEITGVVRVTVTISVFDALIKQMEAVEGYKPEGAPDAAESG